MRRPTDRTLAWANWRQRLAGVRLPVTPGDPQCGFYRAKRHGNWAGVQIDIVAEVDEETGELLGDERFVAFVGADAFYDRNYVDEIWLRCCDKPISETEFERLLKAPKVNDLSREVIV